MTSTPVLRRAARGDRATRRQPNYASGRPVSPAERVLYPALMVLTVLAGWLAVTRYATFIPTPLQIVKDVPDFVSSQAILTSVGASLARVAVGTVGALVAGLIAAYLMTASRVLRRGIAVYVTVCFGIPGLAAALFSLMVFGLADTGVYVAVAIVTFPFATIAFRDGISSVDTRLSEMVRVYRLGWLARLRQVTIPTITPYVISAARNIHALAWKITIVAEVFLARDGIGAKFQIAFENFQLNVVILWLAVFLIVLFGVEYCVLGPIERYAYRWKK